MRRRQLRPFIALAGSTFAAGLVAAAPVAHADVLSTVGTVTSGATGSTTTATTLPPAPAPVSGALSGISQTTQTVTQSAPAPVAAPTTASQPAPASTPLAQPVQQAASTVASAPQQVAAAITPSDPTGGAVSGAVSQAASDVAGGASSVTSPASGGTTTQSTQQSSNSTAGQTCLGSLPGIAALNLPALSSICLPVDLSTLLSAINSGGGNPLEPVLAPVCAALDQVTNTVGLPDLCGIVNCVIGDLTSANVTGVLGCLPSGAAATKSASTASLVSQPVPAATLVSDAAPAGSATPGGPMLPFTGGNIAATAAAGLGLLGTGGVASALARRRRFARA